MKKEKNNKSNADEILHAMFDQAGINDPHAKRVIKRVFTKYNVDPGERDADKEVIRRLRIQNKKMFERIASLKEQLKQARLNRNQALNRMNDLRRLNRELSGALGSCPVCWGEDQHCARCGGEGIPGWGNVNKKWFTVYVLPVLEKLYGREK